MRRTILLIAVTLSLFTQLSLAYAHPQPCSAGPEQFGIEPGSLAFTWTAYKFTEKKPVSGSFSKVLLKAPTTATTQKELFQGVSFSIDTESVSSGDPVRDQNLREAFFGLLTPKTNIEGKVKNVDEKMLAIELHLHGQNFTVQLPYLVEADGQTIKAAGDFNMLDIGFAKAFESLHERCKLLHTGTDGVSKTWPDFHIEIAAKMTKTCQ
jgi:polyisoprenoid-binding protein YceI